MRKTDRSASDVVISFLPPAGITIDAVTSQNDLCSNPSIHSPQTISSKNVLRPQTRGQIFMTNVLLPLSAMLVGTSFGALAGFSSYGAFFICSFLVNFLGVMLLAPRAAAKIKEFRMRYHDVAFSNMFFHDKAYSMMMLSSLVLLAWTMPPNVALAKDSADKLFSLEIFKFLGDGNTREAAKVLFTLFPWLGTYTAPSRYLGSFNIQMKLYRALGMPGQPGHALLLKVRGDLDRIPWPKGNHPYLSNAFFEELYSLENVSKVLPEPRKLTPLNMIALMLSVANIFEMPLWLNLSNKGWADFGVHKLPWGDAISAIPSMLFYMDMSADFPEKFMGFCDKARKHFSFVLAASMVIFGMAIGLGSSKGFFLETQSLVAHNNITVGGGMTPAYQSLVPEVTAPYYPYYMAFFAGLVNNLFYVNMLDDTLNIKKTFSVSFSKALVEKILPHYHQLAEHLSEKETQMRDAKLALENGLHALSWRRPAASSLDPHPSTGNIDLNSEIDLDRLAELRDKFWKAVDAQKNASTNDVPEVIVQVNPEVSASVNQEVVQKKPSTESFFATTRVYLTPRTPGRSVNDDTETGVLLSKTPRSAEYGGMGT